MLFFKGELSEGKRAYVHLDNVLFGGITRENNIEAALRVVETRGVIKDI